MSITIGCEICASRVILQLQDSKELSGINKNSVLGSSNILCTVLSNSNNSYIYPKWNQLSKPTFSPPKNPSGSTEILSRIVSTNSEKLFLKGHIIVRATSTGISLTVKLGNRPTTWVCGPSYTNPALVNWPTKNLIMELDSKPCSYPLYMGGDNIRDNNVLYLEEYKWLLPYCSTMDEFLLPRLPCY